MNKKRLMSVRRVSVSAIVLVFMMNAVLTEEVFDIAHANSASITQMIEYHSASITQMIERHLQDGRTNLSSEQIPSLARLLYEEANFYGIDYRLVLAIMAVESNYRNDAVSPAGARGIMQIQPILASFVAKVGGIPYEGVLDLFDPENNVRFGLYYLSWLSATFKNTNEVLLAYNVGHNRARKLLAHAGDADSSYTRRVMGEYERNMTSLPAI
jgi:soluble lytic murein transglycosylase